MCTRRGHRTQRQQQSCNHTAGARRNSRGRRATCAGRVAEGGWVQRVAPGRPAPARTCARSCAAPRRRPTARPAAWARRATAPPASGAPAHATQRARRSCVCVLAPGNACSGLGRCLVFLAADPCCRGSGSNAPSCKPHTHASARLSNASKAGSSPRSPAARGKRRIGASTTGAGVLASATAGTLTMVGKATQWLAMTRPASVAVSEKPSSSLASCECRERNRDPRSAIVISTTTVHTPAAPVAMRGHSCAVVARKGGSGVHARGPARLPATVGAAHQPVLHQQARVLQHQGVPQVRLKAEARRLAHAARHAVPGRLPQHLRRSTHACKQTSTHAPQCWPFAPCHGGARVRRRAACHSVSARLAGRAGESPEVCAMRARGLRSS